MLYVTIYLPTDTTTRDALVATYPRHRAYLDEFAKGGQVVHIGTFADGLEPQSMAVFRSAEAAEEFVANDPFVLEGLVFPEGPREWNSLDF